MSSTPKGSSLIYNPHRNEYEVWDHSEVICHGTDLEAIQTKYPHLELKEK